MQRLLTEVDRRIAAGIASELAEIRMHADARTAAIGRVVSEVRKQLRADLCVKEAHASGDVVTLPKFLGKRHDAT